MQLRKYRVEFTAQFFLVGQALYLHQEMLLQFEELAELGSNFPAYTGTYWPVESAFTNELAYR